MHVYLFDPPVTWVDRRLREHKVSKVQWFVTCRDGITPEDYACVNNAQDHDSQGDIGSLQRLCDTQGRLLSQDEYQRGYIHERDWGTYLMADGDWTQKISEAAVFLKAEAEMKIKNGFAGSSYSEFQAMTQQDFALDGFHDIVPPKINPYLEKALF